MQPQSLQSIYWIQFIEILDELYMLGVMAKANSHLTHSQPGEKNMHIKCCTLGTILISAVIFVLQRPNLLITLVE